MQSCWH